MFLIAAGAKTVEQFFKTMSRQLTEHEWTVVKLAGDEESQLATFYRHWVCVYVVCDCVRLKLLLLLHQMFFN